MLFAMASSLLAPTPSAKLFVARATTLLSINPSPLSGELLNNTAAQVSNGQFIIAGGQPGMKVSWQVTGVRQDAYAKAHPLQVTVDKSKAERGYYIHPELYGAPADKSLASAHRAVVMQQINQK